MNPPAETERAGMETLLLSGSGESGRPGRGLRAGQRHGGGHQGTWEIPKPPAEEAGTGGEGNGAEGKGEGSLSPLIVPMKAGEPDPRDPGSREGEDRGHGPVVGSHGRDQRPP